MTLFESWKARETNNVRNFTWRSWHDCSPWNYYWNLYIGGKKTSLSSRQYFHKKSVNFWWHISRLTLDLWSLTSLVLSFYIWSNGHILHDLLLKGMFKTFSALTARNKLKVNIQDGLESGRSSSSGIDSAAVHAAPGTCSASWLKISPVQIDYQTSSGCIV